MPSSSSTSSQELKASWINTIHEKRTVATTSCAANEISPPRSGHVTFEANDRLYVFGGYAEEEDGNGHRKRYATNDLWYKCKNDARGEWNRAVQTGNVPGPRLVSAAAVLDGRPYLFGGWDPQTAGTGGIILDTVHVLDTTTHSWSKIDATIPDGPTSRHIALALPTNAITMALLHNHRCLNHVYLFDSSSGSFTKQKTTGVAPSSRGLHAATMLGTTTHALFFGGAAQDGNMSNEAFILNTVSWEWKRVTTSNTVTPSPRAAPSLISISEKCAILFGGAEATANGLNAKNDVWALHLNVDTGEGEWEPLLMNDEQGYNESLYPPARNAATLNEISMPKLEDSTEGTTPSGGKSKYYLLQGGWAPFRRTWADSFVLHISFS